MASPCFFLLDSLELWLNHWMECVARFQPISQDVRMPLHFGASAGASMNQPDKKKRKNALRQPWKHKHEHKDKGRKHAFPMSNKTSPHHLFLLFPCLWSLFGPFGPPTHCGEASARRTSCTRRILAFPPFHPGLELARNQLPSVILKKFRDMYKNGHNQL